MNNTIEFIPKNIFNLYDELNRLIIERDNLIELFGIIEEDTYYISKRDGNTSIGEEINSINNQINLLVNKIAVERNNYLLLRPIRHELSPNINESTLKRGLVKR
mgnify:CR=1 FL=1